MMRMLPLILLVSLLSSFENFVESFVVGKDSLTLKEVKAALHTRKLRQKAIVNNVDNGIVGCLLSPESLKRKRGLIRA